MTLAERTSELVAPPPPNLGTLNPTEKTVSTEGKLKPSFFCNPDTLKPKSPIISPNYSDDFEPIIANYWKKVDEAGKTWYRVQLPHNCPDHLLDKVISVKFYEGQEGMKSTWCTHCKAPVDVDIESLQKEIFSPESISQKQEKKGLRFVFPGKHKETEEPLTQPEPWLKSYKLI